MTLLDVQDLRAYFFTKSGAVKAVDNVNFSMEKGDSLGLAGESGCGKTTTALTLMGLLPHPGRILEGSQILFDGMDITKLTDNELRKKIRWKRISLIFQGAMNALNPLYKIGDQIVEGILLHERVSVAEARERSEKLLELIGIETGRSENYAHEFSGGMRQRAMIAMALACNPDIIIADEPTTALDVIVQAQVLKLIKQLQKQLDISLILITHDLSVITEICNKTAIMYAGKIVECADTATIFKKPQHPYTQGLIGAFPSIKGEKKRLISIPGIPPDLINPPPGCRFHPRCPYAMDICRKEEPEYFALDEDHQAACHLLTKG